MKALVTLVLLLGGFDAVAASSDPAAVSPGMYAVLLENEHVRVVEYRIEPGEREDWHTHPARVMYVVQGGTLRVTLESGDTLISEETTGAARWMGPVGPHFGENIGDTTVRIIMTEVKSAEGSAVLEDAESLRQLVD